MDCEHQENRIQHRHRTQWNNHYHGSLKLSTFCFFNLHIPNLKSVCWRALEETWLQVLLHSLVGYEWFRCYLKWYDCIRNVYTFQLFLGGPCCTAGFQPEGTFLPVASSWYLWKCNLSVLLVWRSAPWAHWIPCSWGGQRRLSGCYCWVPSLLVNAAAGVCNVHTPQGGSGQTLERIGQKHRQPEV